MSQTTFEEVLRLISDNLGFNPLDRESCLAEVKQNGYNIQWIHNPDKELQLEAVKRDGYSIQFIQNPDKEVQLEAVKQNGYSIQWIHNPDKKVQLVAIEQSGYDIRVIAMCPNWTEITEDLYNYLICKDIIE
jgi:hypothetical protein